MKKILIISFFALLLAVSQPVKSFAAKENNVLPPNYAVVNVVYVMSQSKAIKSITEQVNAYKEKLNKQIQIKRNELEQNRQDLYKKESALSPKEFETARNKLQEKLNLAQLDLDKKFKSLENVREEALTAVEKSIGNIVDQIAKSNKYELVLQANTLARYPTNKDISNEVVAKLNKNTPFVKVKNPF